jgi:hypothetical protein
MKKIQLREVEPGEVVARPVATSGGIVMVQPGAVLTQDIIARLENLGVDSVWLEGAAANAKSLDVVLAELDQRFAGHDADALMMELKDVVASCIRQGAMDARD